MYLYRIKINNFRNIKALDWKPNKGINVLFGPNGSGKSNIACAINMLFNGNFNDDVFEYSDFFECDLNNNIEIECWIGDIESINASISEFVQHIDNNDKIVEDDTNENLKTVLIIRLSSNGVEKEWDIIQSIGFSPLTNTIRKSLNFEYLNSDRIPEKDINLTKSGLFYKSTKDNVLIWNKLNEIGKNTVKETNDKIEKDEQLNKEFIEIFKNNKNSFYNHVSIGVKDIASSYFNSGFQFITNYEKYYIPLSKHSRGRQNLFLFDLILNSVNEESIVYIEELEQNLEPINQRKVAIEFVDKIKGQLFITSHSASLLEYFSLEDMFYVRNGNVLNVIGDEKSMIQILKFNKHSFLESLMSSKVILCEGKSEYNTLPLYSRLNDNYFLKNNIYVLKVDGKGNFQKYLKIYDKLKISTYILLDNDNDNQSVLKDCCDLTQTIFLQNRDYEDIIYPVLKSTCNKLDELIPFIEIKNYLKNFSSSKDGAKEKYKDLKEKIDGLDWTKITKYSELYPYKFAFKLILHQKFISDYHSSFIADMLVENNLNPVQYKNLFDYFKGRNDLKNFNEKKNIKLLGEEC